MFEIFINCLFFLLGIICFGVAIFVVLLLIILVPIGFKSTIDFVREELKGKSDEEDSDL